MPPKIAAQFGHQVPCIEQRTERREETHEEGGETRKERGESRGDRITPDLSFLIGAARGVTIFAMYVSRVSIRLRGSYQVFFTHTGAKKRGPCCLC